MFCWRALDFICVVASDKAAAAVVALGRSAKFTGLFFVHQTYTDTFALRVLSSKRPSADVCQRIAEHESARD